MHSFSLPEFNYIAQVLCEMSQQVLNLPELIATIFGLMDRKYNFHNALVCRTWSVFALREVWRDLDNLHALFELLAPLKLQTDHNLAPTHIFSKMPTSEGWQNFDRYSSFVRVLSYKAVPGKHPLSPHTFADVSQTRPRKIILPQLRRLVWDPPDVQDTIPRMRPAFAVLFLHSGVTSISMTFPDVPSIEPQGPTLLQVAACAPYLNDFTLNTKTHPVLIELCTLISNLPRLKVVTIPERFYTKRILNACSRLNVLHTINFGHRLRADFDISLAYQPIPPDVLSEPFQTLRTLRLNLNPIDITTAINSIPAPQRLTYMHIRLAHVEAENMARLIAFISRSSKALRGLDFTSGSSIQGRNDNIPTLSLSILRPLTLLPHLQSLSLLHLSPCALSLNDIDSLLSGLPTLVYLTLNNIPHYYEESPIGLDVLAIAGRRCRLLRTLGVLVDSTLPVTALPIKAGPQDPLLSNLEELSVGLSRITEDTTHSTAILLSNVLPITCDLEYGGSWSGGKSHQSRGTHAMYSRINSRLQLWDEVDGLLTLLRGARPVVKKALDVIESFVNLNI